MKIKEFRVFLCDRKEIRDFIEKWHYSKSINGIKASYCFKLMYNDKIIGAMIFGRLAMGGVAQKYVENENDIIELRRLCCIDDTPKNTESFFIGYTLKWLKKNTNLKMVISYADNEFNHIGIVYKATNFKLVGETIPGRVIWFNGKRYHDKCIRVKYNGKLKPFAQRIKKALETGDAFYKDTKSKNIYVYDLRG